MDQKDAKTVAGTIKGQIYSTFYYDSKDIIHTRQMQNCPRLKLTVFDSLGGTFKYSF